MSTEPLRLTLRKRIVLRAIQDGVACDISACGVARITSALWQQGALDLVDQSLKPSNLAAWRINEVGKIALAWGQTCQFCRGRVPDSKPGNRPRTTCDACIPKARAKGWKAAGEVMRSRRQPIPEKRTCSRCGVEKLVNLDNFTPQLRDPVTREIIEFARWCRPCKAKAQIKRVENATAEQKAEWRARASERYVTRYRSSEEFREKERARRRNWYSEHTESARLSHERWLEKMRADPERYAAFLEYRRIDYRLRRIRAGLPVRDGANRAAPALESEFKQGGLVPLRPIRKWMVVTFPNQTDASIALLLETSERRINRWMNPKQHWTYVDLIDAALVAYGEPWVMMDVYPNLAKLIVPSLAWAWRLDADRVLEIGFDAAVEEAA